MLDGDVLVEISGDAERRQLSGVVSIGDAAGEHEDRQPPFVELADAPDQLGAGCVRHPQINHDQVQIVRIGAHVREQLGDRFDDHGAMPRGVERRLEAIAHERRVRGNEHGLACGS